MIQLTRLREIGAGKSGRGGVTLKFWAQRSGYYGETERPYTWLQLAEFLDVEKIFLCNVVEDDLLPR